MSPCRKFMIPYTIEYGNKIDAFVEAPTLYNRSVKEGLL